MKPYSFLEVYQFAKKHSAFYRDLYKDLSDTPNIEDLPLVDSSIFWPKNSPADNQVLTGHQEDGIVFKSGGTSGNAKFSYFTREEWQSLVGIFGEGMGHAAIRDGERVANFFYAGDLYASFIFIMRAIESSRVKVIQLPLGGAADIENIIKTLTEFKIDVWAGPPTTLMKIAESVVKLKAPSPKKVLFGGESFYPDQRRHLTSLFKGVDIRSIGYASVDAGHIGFADLSCGPEEHRAFSKYSIVEIIDADTLKPIYETARRGKIVLTNLTRKLMPIIRYPVGDLGEWTEPTSVKSERKFRILGRSEEGARVGPTTLYYDDLASFLQNYQMQLESTGFQLIIRHFDKLDQLVFRIAKTSQGKITPAELLKHLEKERPLCYDLARDKKMHAVHIDFVKPDELEANLRTGKLKRIIDERF